MHIWVKKTRSASSQSHLICGVACCCTPMLDTGTSSRWDLNLLSLLPYPWIPAPHTHLTDLSPAKHAVHKAFWHLHVLHLFKSGNKNATCIRKLNSLMWVADCKDTIYVIHWLWSPVDTVITYSTDVFLASAGLDRGSPEHRERREIKWKK